MSMFCYQCQETAQGTGCTVKGVCGKQESTANLQDLLIYVLKGISLYYDTQKWAPALIQKHGRFVTQALFATITNANFDDVKIIALIKQGLAIKRELQQAGTGAECRHDAALWFSDDVDEFYSKALEIGVLSEGNEDIRSLRELLVYGLKGIAAYAEHAAVLGFQDDTIYHFTLEGLASTTKNLSVDEMTSLVLKAGEVAVTAMALLDQANTSTYGHPELTKVNIGVRNNPAILISGHDLKDMAMLLEQTNDTGIDVYTHSEMLPANYYPEFKKYEHFVGNYGNAWWKQGQEFTSFNGPIIMTTNCIIPIKKDYQDRIFTTGMAGYPGVKHIPEDQDGNKDFSKVIELAKKCPPPLEIEKGEIVGGFAHHQVLALADKIISAIKSGAIKRFVVMAGCDGRQKGREYFTEVAQELPSDTIILTAGCAKYRYNKLDLGDINGIPRVLDAGQCNDSYSLAVIALKLKEVFELTDINDLPISFDIGWYEQKAVAVLLALLHLGVKGIRLGPTLPGFLSPNVAKVLIDKFNLKATGTVKDDIEDMLN